MFHRRQLDLQRSWVSEEGALTWHKKLVQKQMFGHFDCCTPSLPSRRRKLKTQRSVMYIFFYWILNIFSYWLRILIIKRVVCNRGCLLLFLTVLKDADERDDDQEVDVFNHDAGVHDHCAGRRSRWMLDDKEVLREAQLLCLYCLRSLSPSIHPVCPSMASCTPPSHLHPTYTLACGFLFM